MASTRRNVPGSNFSGGLRNHGLRRTLLPGAAAAQAAAPRWTFGPRTARGSGAGPGLPSRGPSPVPQKKHSEPSKSTGATQQKRTPTEQIENAPSQKNIQITWVSDIRTSWAFWVNVEIMSSSHVTCAYADGSRTASAWPYDVIDEL